MLMFSMCLLGLSINSYGQGSGERRSTPPSKKQTTKSNKPSKQNTKVVGVRDSDLWDFRIGVDEVIRSAGGRIKEEHSVEWVVRSSQKGEELTGAIISGRDSRGGNVCADATINGSVKDGNVEFVVTYNNRFCCPREQMKFTGKLSDDGRTLTGNLEARDAPISNLCYLWYAKVTASRR